MYKLLNILYIMWWQVLSPLLAITKKSFNINEYNYFFTVIRVYARGIGPKRSIFTPKCHRQTPYSLGTIRARPQVVPYIMPPYSSGMGDEY